MRIKEMPLILRPREKLIKYGVKKLSLTELLALIFGSGQKGENVLNLAKKVLLHFGKNKLPQASFNQLIKIKGLGPAKTSQIIAAFELAKRLTKKPKKLLITKPKIIWQQLQEIRDKKKEYFVVFYLDSQNQLIKKEVISIGTLNASLVHPREVFEPAITNFSAQIIIAHNHPSGNSQPSEDDILLTNKLIKAGQILDIPLLDHVIVTENHYFSFQENKLIKNY